MSINADAIVVGPFQTNCFLLWNDEAKEGVVIDPGDEDELIIERIDKHGFKPLAVLLTHGHIDHIGAVAAMSAHYKVPLYIGKGEEGMLANPASSGAALLSMDQHVPKPDSLVEDEQLITIGSIGLRVLATPGHTAAGVCYLEETRGWLFCGDTLFQGSIGRTDLPGGSFDTLINSIKTKIMALPDEIICLPGHGPQTTVGIERQSNPFLTGQYFA